MEVINLDSVDLSSNTGNTGNIINLNKDTAINIDISKSPSLAGAELLMNHNTKKHKDPTGIELDDLTALEKDLNDLTNTSTTNIGEGIKLNVDEVITSPTPPPHPSNKSGPTITKLGEPERSWDGFQQVNNITIDPDKHVSAQPPKSREDLLKDKFNYLRKLEGLEKKGIRLSKQYTMESSLEEMMGEYETIKAEREKKNSVKFQGRMLMAAVTGLEFLNNRFDPFDFKLDGWSEQVNENVDDYDEIFGELHEKYSSKAKMAPELKLLFQLSGSAIMLHMTNTMFKSSIPGMDDILRQNPELMQQFTQAAVNQMGEQKPGFGNFMNDMMGQENARAQPPDLPTAMSPGPPPVAMKTRPSARMDNFSRQDIGFGRGEPQQGVNMNDSYENPDKPQRTARTTRPEMKGPSGDIDHLLSGLKSKNSNSNSNSTSFKNISMNETMNEISNSTTKPSRSKRRPVSEKNTISLDI
jgi:hypothetical protein